MFLLNLQSKEPINDQIQEQIQCFIDAGVLKPGDKLPSVRELAKDNGINPNTVARAYRELEQRGIVNNIPKKGVYVSDTAQPETPELEKIVTSLKEKGITKQDLLHTIDKVYGGENAQN